VPLRGSLQGWLQRIAGTAEAQQYSSAFNLTYRIATLQTHCKSLASSNQAGGVVGKCRQLKIRFARHFGQARGLARRNEKKVLLVYRNYTDPQYGLLLV
jgi:hypothetical protein